MIPPGRKLPPEGIEVRVNVIDDQSGMVRLFRPQESSDWEQGAPAVQAISHWRFEVPCLGGEAVDAYVTITVVFKPSE